jgi:hypothetical protein
MTVAALARKPLASGSRPLVGVSIGDFGVVDETMRRDDAEPFIDEVRDRFGP